ncbi:hypothetical protein [Paenibacillus protaetiae]|uniref:Uncharacterized protein n=1 Tax=Paenibacillus protaetiae TaxID=2509456 RepID=A0A4P6EXA7_9BACL|nr:hypothetical protein [Paenibacillus protaetiae]QAY65237.1 hypothetical protein ET464_01410 [Paenibacillus protaetiae]
MKGKSLPIILFLAICAWIMQSALFQQDIAFGRSEISESSEVANSTVSESSLGVEQSEEDKTENVTNATYNQMGNDQELLQLGNKLKSLSTIAYQENNYELAKEIMDEYYSLLLKSAQFDNDNNSNSIDFTELTNEYLSEIQNYSRLDSNSSYSDYTEIARSSSIIATSTFENQEVLLDKPFDVAVGGSNYYTFIPLESGNYQLKTDNDADESVAIYADNLMTGRLISNDYYDSIIQFYSLSGNTYIIEIDNWDEINRAILNKTDTLQIKNIVDISLTDDSYQELDYIPKQSGEYKVITGAYGGFGYTSPTDVSIYDVKDKYKLIANGSSATIRLLAGQEVIIAIEDEDGAPLHTRVHITSANNSDLLEEVPVDLSVESGGYITLELNPLTTGNYTLFTDYFEGQNTGFEPDTVITLYDEQYKLLSYNDDKDRNSLLSSLSNEIKSRTTYYVRVEGFMERQIKTRLTAVYTPPDVTPPTSPVIYASGKTTNYTNGQWTNDKVTIHIGDPASPDTNIIQIKIGETSNWVDTDPYTYYDINTEGITKIYARVIDTSGNMSNPAELEVKIDRTGPSSPSFSVYKSINGNIQFSINNGVDLGSGIFKSQYKVGESGEWTDYLGGIVDLVDEKQKIYIRSVDNIGNIGSENYYKEPINLEYSYTPDNKLQYISNSETGEVIYEFIYDNNGNLVRIIKE